MTDAIVMVATLDGVCNCVTIHSEAPENEHWYTHVTVMVCINVAGDGRCNGQCIGIRPGRQSWKRKKSAD